MIADLDSRTALVTGGGRGIGRGVCLALAEQGADVAVADIFLDAAESVAAEILNYGYSATSLEMDVTDRASIAAAVDETLAQFGSVDILVNNAGVIGAAKLWEREDPSDEDWRMAFDVNVRGMVMASEAVRDLMAAQGWGRIINIASIAGRQGSPDIPHYSTSKAAAISWTQSNALQLARSGVTVNAICPGLIWTPIWDKLARRRAAFGSARADFDGLREREIFERVVESTIPTGREQTPVDIGKLAAFLASDDAKNITGQAINVDGGIRMN